MGERAKEFLRDVAVLGEKDAEIAALKADNEALHDSLNKAEAEVERLRAGIAKESEEVCQALGKVLRYPWFKDDQNNFPGATEAEGVCVGEHVPGTIAAEAAARIAELEEALKPFAGAHQGVEAAYTPSKPHIVELVYDGKPRWSVTPLEIFNAHTAMKGKSDAT